MNFKKDYKDWIAEKKNEWVGKKVVYEEKQYTVVDVDYNGALLIDKPTRFTDTTAVAMWMVKQSQHPAPEVTRAERKIKMYAKIRLTKIKDVFNKIGAEELWTIDYYGGNEARYHENDFAAGGKMERFANYTIDRFSREFACECWIG